MNYRKSILALFLSIIVLLSGCFGFVNQNSSSDPQNNLDQEFKPSSVPGIYQNSTVDIGLLLKNHKNKLGDNYRYTVKSIEKSGNSTIKRKKNVILSSRGEMRIYQDVYSKSGSSIEVIRRNTWWSDGKRLLLKRNATNTKYFYKDLPDDENAARLEVIDSTPLNLIDSGLSSYLELVNEFEVTGTVTKDGEPYVWIRGTSVNTRDTNGRSVTKLIALVDSSGVIRELYVEFQENKNGEQIDTSITLRYTDWSNSISRPSWYSDAIKSKKWIKTAQLDIHVHSDMGLPSIVYDNENGSLNEAGNISSG